MILALFVRQEIVVVVVKMLLVVNFVFMEVMGFELSVE